MPQFFRHCGAARLRQLGFLLLTLSLPWAAQAVQVWAGQVITVVDGDTLVLLKNGEQAPVKLRIEGIDAPEICQSGGAQAREALTRLAWRQSVVVRLQGQDSYGRQVGRVSVQGLDVGAELVRSGQAWASQFRTGKGPYAHLQRQAQHQKIGLFSAKQKAMPPSMFRKFHGSCHAP